MNQYHWTLNNEWKGKKVAILATDGFELSELRSPKEALREARATVEVISLKAGTILGWSGGNWEGTEEVDRTTAEADTADYDALMIPGGTFSPDKLRMNAGAVAMVRSFMDARKPVAALRLRLMGVHHPLHLSNGDQCSTIRR